MRRLLVSAVPSGCHDLAHFVIDAARVDLKPGDVTKRAMDLGAEALRSLDL